MDKVIVFLFLGFMCSSCNKKIYINNDLYGFYKEDYIKKMYNWEKGFLAIDTLSQKVYEINAADLKKISANKKYTWVVIGTDNCTGCLEKFAEIKNTFETSTNKENAQLLVINALYLFPNVLKEFTQKYNYTNDYYVLSNDTYGSQVYKKVDRFIKELLPAGGNIKRNSGLCKHLVLDQKGIVIFYEGGMDVKLKDIKQIINK